MKTISNIRLKPAQIRLFGAMGVLALVLSLGAGCTPVRYAQAGRKAQFTVVSATIAPDSASQAYLAPYKLEMERQMNEVVGTTTSAMEKAYPQGLLGNFVTDLLLVRGKAKLEPGIEIAITNSGGLRVPLPKGNITLGKVYELMPFDNMIVVLTLGPPQMDSLLTSIASGKETLYAGMEVTVVDGKVTAANIQGKPWDRAKSYRILITDYLADGGSNLVFFKRRTNLVNTGIFMRDFIADYMRDETKAGRQLSTQLDSRLQITPVPAKSN
jgi:2',3'-cyclic-nucleotide 2'-phosphodiesterase (5'-nucleotidase family)